MIAKIKCIRLCIQAKIALEPNIHIKFDVILNIMLAYGTIVKKQGAISELNMVVFILNADHNRIVQEADMCTQSAQH